MGEAKTYQLEPNTGYAVAVPPTGDAYFDTGEDGLFTTDDAAVAEAIERTFLVRPTEVEAEPDPDRVELFRIEGGEWRWRRLSADGTVAAESEEAFAKKGDAREAATAANEGLEVS